MSKVWKVKILVMFVIFVFSILCVIKYGITSPCKTIILHSSSSLKEQTIVKPAVSIYKATIKGLEIFLLINIPNIVIILKYLVSHIMSKFVNKDSCI